MSSINVLLASAGRRPYLVRWFKAALAELGIDGQVIVVDHDCHAPSRQEADHFLVAPRVADECYAEWLGATLRDQQVALALSINDFELSQWATVIPREAPFSPLVRLAAGKQRAVEDKLGMAELLESCGIATPRTVLASAAELDSPVNREMRDGVVVKGRYGSGSRGLGVVEVAHVEGALLRASGEVTDETGRPAADLDQAKRLTVLQQRIIGQEFGVDVIADLRGEFVGILARRKISMRGGETDRAVSVDPEPFLELGQKITKAVGHSGLIDVDVICDESAKTWVIDINPRFGGGYPFSHLAGANVPKAYIAWAAGLKPQDSWLRSSAGIVSAKYIETAIVELPDAVAR